jgi:hypothetical protein
MQGRWVHFASINGLPDITWKYKGIYIGLELKMKTGSFTKHQKETLPMLINNGSFVFIIDSFEELFNTIELVKANVIEVAEGILIKQEINHLSESQLSYRKKLKI